MAKKVESFSILDQGLVLEGTLTCTGKMLIRGILKGALSGEDITISPEGAVEADIRAENMTIGGRFEGKLDASRRVMILSTGNCCGEITCRDLVVEAGGVLNAKITRLPDMPIEKPKAVFGGFGKKKMLPNLK